MALSAETIGWDIYEEHLDEAAFLFELWQNAFLAANYTLAEVRAGPEERLRAHLDALILGGKPVAERLLTPALTDPEPGKAFAAAWSLLHAEDADYLALVLATLWEGKAGAPYALARAFALSERQDLGDRLKPSWDAADTPVLVMLLDTLSRFDSPWVNERLVACLESDDPVLMQSALRALRRAPNRRLTAHVERLCTHTDPSVRVQALATGFVLRVPSVSEACRQQRPDSPDVFRLALALQALTATASDEGLFEAWLADEKTQRHAVWALGFAGDDRIGSRLIGLLSNDMLAPLAGEALSAMTGVAIEGELALPGETKGPGVQDVEPSDPLPEVPPEDGLLMPNAEALAAWWRQAKADFASPGFYSYGLLRARESMPAILTAATMWRRPVLVLAAAVQSQAGVPTDVLAWARWQR